MVIDSAKKFSKPLSDLDEDSSEYSDEGEAGLFSMKWKIMKNLVVKNIKNELKIIL